MNKNITPLILIVLAIGIYFTFTRLKIDELGTVREVNAKYQQALDNSEALIKVRDNVLSTYNKINPDDQDRLEKILPNNVDNVRLIIDLNGIGSRHGLVIKNIKTSTPKDMSSSNTNTNVNANLGFDAVKAPSSYNTVTLNFDVSANYTTFTDFLKDLESSLRILEISRIGLKVNDLGTYDYSLEVKTYWLKQ